MTDGGAAPWWRPVADRLSPFVDKLLPVKAHAERGLAGVAAAASVAAQKVLHPTSGAEGAASPMAATDAVADNTGPHPVLHEQVQNVAAGTDPFIMTLVLTITLGAVIFAVITYVWVPHDPLTAAAPGRNDASAAETFPTTAAAPATALPAKNVASVASTTTADSSHADLRATRGPAMARTMMNSSFVEVSGSSRNNVDDFEMVPKEVEQ